MNKTIKLSFLVTLLTISGILYSQTYRLEIGYNNPVRLGSNVSKTYFNGIKIGGTAEFDLKNNLSLLTGVLYNVVYSDKIQGYPDSATVTYQTFGHFLDIPLQITYSYPLTKNLRLFAFAGPTFDIGLFQNTKIINDQKYNSENPYYVAPGSFNLYNSSSGSYMLNRINLQIGVGGGVQWKKYLLKAGYDFGLNNLDSSGANTLHQKGWYVTFGYQL